MRLCTVSADDAAILSGIVWLSRYVPSLMKYYGKDPKTIVKCLGTVR